MNPLVKLPFLLLLVVPLIAQQHDPQNIAASYGLYGGERSTVQWMRIFSSQKHLRRYHLDKLDKQTLEALRKYLVSHAADSDQPRVPGL